MSQYMIVPTVFSEQVYLKKDVGLQNSNTKLRV